MEDPLKVYNDVLKISGGEAIANEVPFAGLTKNSTLTWTCPSCLQQIPWNDETMWSIKNMENIAIDHLKSHGYSNEEIKNIMDIDFQHLFTMDRIVGEAVANEVEIDEYDKDDIFQFLFDLRDSGVTNMFGSGSYVKEAFPLLTRKQVQEVVLEWMDNFEELRQRMGIESYAGEEDGTDFDHINSPNLHSSSFNSFLREIGEYDRWSTMTENEKIYILQFSDKVDDGQASISDYKPYSYESYASELLPQPHTVENGWVRTELGNVKIFDGRVLPAYRLSDPDSDGSMDMDFVDLPEGGRINLSVILNESYAGEDSYYIDDQKQYYNGKPYPSQASYIDHEIQGHFRPENYEEAERKTGDGYVYGNWDRIVCNHCGIHLNYDQGIAHLLNSHDTTTNANQAGYTNFYGGNDDNNWSGTFMPSGISGF